MITIEASGITSGENAKRTHGGLSLTRNVSWVLVANIIYAAFQWGILAVLTKLVAPEIVGQFGIAYAIGAPVIMLANLFLRQIQATDARDEYLFGHYLALRLFTSSLALVVIGAIAFITNFSWTTKVIIIVVGLAKGIESLQDIIYGLLLKQERMDRMAISIICKAPLELLAMSLGVLLTHSLLAGVLGMILVRVTLLVTYDRRSALLVLPPPPAPAVRRESSTDRSGYGAFKPVWSWGIMGHLAWLSLPVALAVTLNSLNVNIPRYFISHYLGEESLGIFVALAYVIVGGNMVVMALGLSLSPRLSQYYAQARPKAFRHLVLWGSLIVALLGLAGVVMVHLVGREFLTLIYRPEYAAQVRVLLWLMLAAAMGYVGVFLRQVITAARFLRIQLPIYVVTSITLVATCFYFIPLAGLMGAAYAIFCSSLIMFLLNGGVIGYIFSHHHKIAVDYSEDQYSM